MQGKSRQEIYQGFIDFIGTDIQRERHQVNRRMFNVFLWCFLLPAVSAITLLLLVKARILPHSVKGYLEWVILIFPVVYALYILSFEVLAQIPMAIRRGGIVTTLSQSVKDGEWRQRVCTAMARVVETGTDDWNWVIASFEMDLQSLRHRTRYLTALAGAVFFLLMQGIDSLGDEESKVTWIKSPIGWIETSSSDLSQFVGLALFLVLFYVSGNQTYHSLTRYLDCAKLIQLGSKKGSSRA